ncbi:ADP-ribosylglycohydrolase family protein [Bryobacter aggregatus]|uniref:ADP-ribosylglycohydrolase family protein n=1 Tax=Bryobacter aggregatus TaxID=360054 RepID=UPI0004E1AF84|nr:ADP-ribosylglycohydrolase family protein [Bryobacter aggregatus]
MALDLDRGRFRGALMGIAAADSEADGRWGADTSLALCMAESVIACRGVDLRDLMDRYLRWYRRGYWSSRGYCFGIDEGQKEALERFERTGEIEALPSLQWLVAPVVLRYAADRDAALVGVAALGASPDIAKEFWKRLTVAEPFDAGITFVEAIAGQGASAGQMAGVSLGIRAIPPEWRERCYRAAEIIGIADRIYDLVRAT